MNRIESKFKELRSRNEKALIVFITAGYPDLETTYKLVLEFAQRGVDIIELGVPFSDPMADGAIIQEASMRALQKKVNLANIMSLVKKARQHTQIPICLMTYYNPVFCMGESKFSRMAADSGVDGIIVPDLPPEEGKSLLRFTRENGLDTICFISPTTAERRIKYISSIARGFIYYVSLTGTTGARTNLASDLIVNLKKIKSYTDKPVCAGFGISTAKQVKTTSAACDGVIVGSAVVGKIKENIGKAGLIDKVGNFVAALKSATYV